MTNSIQTLPAQLHNRLLTRLRQGAATARTEARAAARTDDRGFTLIELLVVVIIIGILAAIAIPVYLGVQSSAKDAAAKSDLVNAKTAIVAYQTETGVYPDPVALTNTTTLGKYGYTISSTATGYTAGYSPSTVVVAPTTTFCVSIKAPSNAAAKFYITESTGVSNLILDSATVKPAGC